jgi:hypothetical protein
MHFTSAPQASHTLFDSEQPESFGLVDIEPAAVILDRKRYATRFLLDSDANGGGLRVARTVV